MGLLVFLVILRLCNNLSTFYSVRNVVQTTPLRIAHATIMTSMSLKFKEFPKVEIRITPVNVISMRKLHTLVNGSEIRADSSGTTVLIHNSLALIFDSFEQKNVRVIFATDGISLDCRFVPLTGDNLVGEMNCRLQIPEFPFKEDIKGLAGNWKVGNPEADLTPPAAPASFKLNINDPQSIYVAFNNSFKVAKIDSQFTYGPGETWESINTPDIPLVPELNPLPSPIHPNTNDADIKEKCQGSASAQCTFDARFSGAVLAAKETAAFIEEVRRSQEQLGKPMLFCPAPDLFYADVRLTGLGPSDKLEVVGCKNGARDTNEGTFTSNCNGTHWSQDWTSQKSRCCVPSFSMSCPVLCCGRTSEANRASCTNCTVQYSISPTDNIICA